MAITFDGTAKTMTLSSGTIVLDVVDCYSDWKRWVESGNAQYLPAFNPVGGNTIDTTAGTSIPLYAFLVNGWRIVPQSANHTLAVVGGVLLVDGGGDPFVNPSGSFVVRINYQQPVQAISVSTAGGGGGGMTTEQSTKLDEVWKRLGLDAANPLINTESLISAGSMVQIDVETNATQTVLTRQ